jgi:hypothetical protein
MTSLHRSILGAAVGASAFLAAAGAGGQQRPVSGARITYPSHANHFSWEGRHGGFHGHGGGVWILRQAQDERVIVVEREVVREKPAAAPATPAPPASPRKPYVIGASYASLPGGCMKWIEGGASYYYCGGGEWYRQLGKQYRAVARP